ncbi:MAG: serine/threonine-protein kinase, partial [Myxococcota bacterium]|nr:serine/threonine-protein kinase [Myxococcota bacterium]
MNQAELYAVLKIDKETLQSLWHIFIQNKEGDPDDRAREFLVYLRDNDHISDAEFHKLNSEQNIDISEMIFEGEGPISGITLENLLGEGAMGEVFLARDIALKRSVALKRIKGEIDEEAVDLFVKEALVTAQLEHPNIVPIYSALRSGEDGIAYTMKLIRGKELTDLIQECQEALQRGDLVDLVPLNERLEIFLKVCDGLSYAHARKVIHRDLKPENIMLGPFGEVYVMDWGIARLLSETNLSGEISGTMSYISPEQAKGDIGQLSPKSDQYSLGLILQELVTLRKAIPAGTQEDIYRRAHRGQTAPIIHNSPKISIRPELKAIIEKATETDPEFRYPNVEEFAEDIRRFLREEPVLARPDPPIEKIQRWLFKHRTLTVVLFALIIIVALGSNMVNLHFQQQAENERRAQEERQKEMARQREKEIEKQNKLREQSIVKLINSVVAQSQKIDRTFLE